MAGMQKVVGSNPTQLKAAQVFLMSALGVCICLAFSFTYTLLDRDSTSKELI